MIDDQAVKQVHIVLAESAEIEEFVDRCLLQAQLSETYSLVSTPASRLHKPQYQYTYTVFSGPRSFLHGEESDRKCGGTCGCRAGWRCHSFVH